MAMIDAFFVFTKGGLQLWSTQLVKIKGNPLDWLIKEVLLEERVGESSAKVESYSLQWKLASEMDLCFVVVYQGIMQLAYLEALLSGVSKEFISHVSGTFGNGLHIKRVDFDAPFLAVRRKVDKEQLEIRRRGGGKPAVADGKKKGGNLDAQKAPAAKGSTGGGGDAEAEEDGDGDADAKKKVAEARERLMRSRGMMPKKEKPKVDPAPEDTKGRKKEDRHWTGESKYSEKNAKSLDFSKGGDDVDANVDKQRVAFLGDSDDEAAWEKGEDDVESLATSSDEEADAAKASKGAKGKTGRAAGLFSNLKRGVKNITGGAVLSDEDLDPILSSFRTALMAKNVAADVSIKLSDSVRHSLVGKQTERFTSMSSTVKETLQGAMETLLTPKKSIDVLRAAMAAKNAGRVYSIVFLGVNGVGKSTNLAKVAYYLKHKGGLDVLLCACDTFRAGAVEQLKTHSRCLDVPLFERGYGKDPSDIAKGSIAHAKTNGHDVVLIDTAGRMQDNEPLMRALAKLVHVNTPDLVLFVGEALVGNDATDQVTKFNKALMDFSHNRAIPRGIDGMLLTKYDTVDDKVGAALSMVYVTGQPIVFVGTGQKYTHLRKMQVKEVVKTLLE